jgi:hypothetical protein
VNVDNGEVGVLDRKEFLSKVKIEFRAFQFLLDEYKDSAKAYEAWKNECRFDIISVLERMIFDEGKSADEIRKELDIYCDLIDEDLWWLERNLDLDVYVG